MTTKQRQRTTKSNISENKREQVASQLRDKDLLGHIVTLGSRTGSTHTHSDVVAALKNAGLDEKVAREFQPKQAFARACRQLAKERIIEVVEEYSDEIVFQLTRSEVGESLDGEESKERKYKKETYLRLDTTTGKVKCKKPELQTQAQNEVDRCMEQRTSNDITLMVIKLFRQEAETENAAGDLMPLPGAIGVYMVLREGDTFLSKIEHFLGKLGRKPYTFPIPKGEQNTGNVADTVESFLTSAVEEIQKKTEKITTTTRNSSLEEYGEEYKRTVVKLKAMAQYLGERAKDVEDIIADGQQKLVAKIQEVTKAKEEAPEEDNKRQKIFGHSVSSVIRLLGKERWSFKKVRKLLDNLQVKAHDTSIILQLKAGSKRDCDKIASLTESQLARLESAVAN